VNGRRQSTSGAGYTAARRTTPSVGPVQSPKSVVSSTPKSSTGGLHAPRSAVRTNKPQTSKPAPRSTSLHTPRLSNTATAKTGASVKNGLSLPVREPTSSLPNSPHSSDPDGLDETGNYYYWWSFFYFLWVFFTSFRKWHNWSDVIVWSWWELYYSLHRHMDLSMLHVLLCILLINIQIRLLILTLTTN